MRECHKCKFNSLGSDECLKCVMEEKYNYKFRHYILDTFEAPQQETQGSEKCTTLDDDIEDRLRKALYLLFDLSPLELLTLQGIMQEKTLQQIADSLTKLFLKNDKIQTRHHIFQIRKAMTKKLPSFRSSFLTSGLRKKLKE